MCRDKKTCVNNIGVDWKIDDGIVISRAARLKKGDKEKREIYADVRGATLSSRGRWWLGLAAVPHPARSASISKLVLLTVAPLSRRNILALLLHLPAHSNRIFLIFIIVTQIVITKIFIISVKIKIAKKKALYNLQNLIKKNSL